MLFHEKTLIFSIFPVTTYIFSSLCHRFDNKKNQIIIKHLWNTQEKFCIDLKQV